MGLKSKIIVRISRIESIQVADPVNIQETRLVRIVGTRIGSFKVGNFLGWNHGKEENRLLFWDIHHKQAAVDGKVIVITETRLIRKSSPIPRTYAKCCFTPLFSTGNTGAALLNSNLLSPDLVPPVKYRIIGRHALKGDGSITKPSMSWSVPFGWFFGMAKRCQSEKAQPSPVEVKDIKELKIVEGFVEG